MNRKHLIALLIWTALWAIFFATLILGIERFPSGDLTGQYYAFAQFQAREITAGHLPVWSPGSYGGVPFIADIQSAAFYPLRWLTILVTLPFGFSFYALEWEELIHVWLAGTFTYLLAYEITRSRPQFEKNPGEGIGAKPAFLDLAQWAGLVAAVAFGLGGYLTSYPLLQLTILETVAWLPLVLFLLRRGIQPNEAATVRNEIELISILGAGLALGMSALAGHPQTFLHVAYLSAAYFFFLAWQAHWRWRWVLGLGAAIVGVAVGLALIAYLPAIRFVPETVRNDPTYEFVAKGFPLRDYIQLFIPGPLSFWLPQYSGLVAVFLAVSTGFSRGSWPDRARRAETLFWFGIIIIAAWLSLGGKGGLFALFYKAAPGFSLFRQQERLVNIVSLGVALLAAQGLVLLMSAPTEQRRIWLRRAFTVMSIALLLIGAYLLQRESADGPLDWIALWGRQWLILALIFLILWPFKEKYVFNKDTWRIAALLILLFLDLYQPLHRAMDLVKESPSAVWSHPDWLVILTNDEIARFDSQNLFYANLGEIYDLQDVKGISPLKPQFTKKFEKLPRPLRWQLLNVGHVLATEQIEAQLVEEATIKSSILPGEAVAGFLYRFSEAFPRSWMVYETISADNSDDAFSLLEQNDFDPATQVILTGVDDADLPLAATPTVPPEVTISSLPGGGLELSVCTETPGYLVISEWAFPGWKATLDGRELPLLTANYALLALPIPAGQNDVILTYEAPEVLVGLLFSLLTLLFVAVVTVRWHSVNNIR
jgi:hypothetical protein